MVRQIYNLVIYIIVIHQIIQSKKDVTRNPDSVVIIIYFHHFGTNFPSHFDILVYQFAIVQEMSIVLGTFP